MWSWIAAQKGLHQYLHHAVTSWHIVQWRRFLNGFKSSDSNLNLDTFNHSMGFILHGSNQEVQKVDQALSVVNIIYPLNPPTYHIKLNKFPICTTFEISDSQCLAMACTQRPALCEGKEWVIKEIRELLAESADGDRETWRGSIWGSEVGRGQASVWCIGMRIGRGALESNVSRTIDGFNSPSA